VSEGAWVTPTTVLTTIADTSALKLDFKIPERYAASLSVGAPFRAKLDGRDGTLEAKIIAMEPSIEEATRSLLVRGLIEGDPTVRAGSFAEVELPVTVEGALLVPAIVISPGADGQSIYVERDGHARRVKVELGSRGPELVQVVSGLSPGDRVITSNLLRLTDGAPVQVEAPE
jgi:membrane fusion protein (multidrug efflux system)